MKALVLCLLCLSPLLSGCEKEPSGTNSNGETHPFFSCYVNGKYWHAETPSSLNGPVSLQVTFHPDIENSFSISAILKNDHQYEKMYVAVYNVNGPGIYLMEPGDGHLRGFTDYLSNQCAFFHDTLNPGTFVVTSFDTINRHIEGGFSMMLINPGCETNTMSITDGDFSLNF